MFATDFSFSQIESPVAGSVVPRGRHIIRGWVWPKPGGHFVDVRARVGERLFAGVYGLPRADLAAHFNTGRPVALAAFGVVVELPGGPVDFLLEVLAIGGRWLAFHTVPLEVAPADSAVD